MKGPWHLYVLRCADGTLYTGITTDPERRLREHNEDDRLAARYVRPRRPAELVYRESHPDRAAATRREGAVKRMSRGAKERLVAG